MKQSLKAIDKLLVEIEKNFGKGALMRLGDRSTERIPVISTASPAINEALGCGGYPRGRVVEIYGPEASGKTTLTLHAIAECQRAGGIAAFVDAEHALDVQYASALGVNAKELLVSQPDNGEQALDIAETLVQSGVVDLVVIDSVAALVPEAELNGEMGDRHLGLQARLMSQALRKLAGVAHKTNTTIIFINQLRMKIGVTFGSPETTTGGNALKYYASVRLDIRRIGAVKNGDDIIGNRTRVRVVKNKMAPPFQKVEFDIRYGEGIDVVGAMLDKSVEHGVIEKNGAYYRFGGSNFAQGRERARAVVLGDTKLREKIELGLRTALAAPPAGAQKAA